MLKSAPTHRIIGKADLTRSQFAEQQLKQKGATNGVDQYCVISDQSPLESHTVAMRTDMHPNHPWTEGVEQCFGIAGIIAQISNNKSIAIVTAINCCQRVGKFTAIKPLRQFHELLNSKSSWPKGTVAPDNSS